MNRRTFALSELSPVRDVMSSKSVNALANRLKKKTKVIKASKDKAEQSLIQECRELGPWRQAIELPEGPWTTFENNQLVIEDNKFLNLDGRLNADESATVRSLLHWSFIKRVMPPFQNETVLEIKAGAGAFSLYFLKGGAKSVTSVEPKGKYYSQLEYISEKFKHDNWVIQKEFDSLIIKKKNFDIIFSSNLINSTLMPFAYIDKMLSIADKYVVLDLDMAHSGQHRFRMSLSKTKKEHKFTMSDGLLMSYLQREGILAKNIRRYTNPVSTQMIYVIDVRNRKL